MTDIEFWFSIGSTYSYLSIARLDALEREHGVRFVMRPFSIRTLMMEQGGNPFLNNERKMAYMMRDVERRARHHGLPARFPIQYPIDQYELTNQIAALAAEEGWCRPFVQRVYHHWFAAGIVAGSPENLERSLADIGQDPARVLREAASPRAAARLAAATDQARERGLFGVPSFLVGSEIFWGDDRVDDAIRYGLTGTT